jgi:hypothetical protein
MSLGPPRPRNLHLAALGSAMLLAASAGCASTQQSPPQAPAPAPILADAADTPGTAAEECGKVVVDLERYSRCDLLDEDRRWWVGRWAEYVKIDLALAQNPKLDADSLKLLAVSCRKAAAAVGWAASVCTQQAAQPALDAWAPGATP